MRTIAAVAMNNGYEIRPIHRIGGRWEYAVAFAGTDKKAYHRHRGYRAYYFTRRDALRDILRDKFREE